MQGCQHARGALCCCCNVAVRAAHAYPHHGDTTAAAAAATLHLLHDLQSLNPLPYVAMAANCTLGSLYGQITHDAYIYVPNMIGLMLSECAEQG